MKKFKWKNNENYKYSFCFCEKIFKAKKKILSFS